ncbi:hypothetical protein NC652_041772 [Populus alba x Populus x berolinensis]|nr:hypothetical protein NC652_041772 [Populus alba x Populus x berolinensis]
MNSKQPCQSEPDLPVPPLPALSVRSPSLSTAPTANRRVAIAVDLSDESAYAVKWAVQNYLRPGDAVILRPRPAYLWPSTALIGGPFNTKSITTKPLLTIKKGRNLRMILIVLQITKPICWLNHC